MSPPQRTEALTRWRAITFETLVTLPIVEAHFMQAAGFADRNHLNVRAGYAVHLAIR